MTCMRWRGSNPKPVSPTSGLTGKGLFGVYSMNGERRHRIRQGRSGEKDTAKELSGEFRPDSEKIAALADTLVSEARDTMQQIGNLAHYYQNTTPITFQIRHEPVSALWVYGKVRTAILKNDVKGAEEFARTYIPKMHDETAQLRIMSS